MLFTLTMEVRNEGAYKIFYGQNHVTWKKYRSLMTQKDAEEERQQKKANIVISMKKKKFNNLFNF